MIYTELCNFFLKKVFHEEFVQKKRTSTFNFLPAINLYTYMCKTKTKTVQQSGNSANLESTVLNAVPGLAGIPCHSFSKPESSQPRDAANNNPNFATNVTDYNPK